MKSTRIPDDHSHIIYNQRKATNDLRRLLFALGIKSARKIHLIKSFAGIQVRVPGLYANVKDIGGT